MEGKTYSSSARSESDEFLASTREILSKNSQILESSSDFMARIRATIQSVKSTESTFQDFQQRFDTALETVLENSIPNKTDPTLSSIPEYGVPETTTPDKALKILGKARKVVFMTGAGVSAESGVFTYKGNEETFPINGVAMKLREVLNISILENYPLDFWKSVQFVRSRILRCCPNPVHKSLSDLLKLYTKKSRKFSLITQNIDGFDREALKNCPDFYEVHGNIHEIRCKGQCKGIFDWKKIKNDLNEVPTCERCGGILRPNVLLYGEDYSEEFYRSDTAKRACEQAEVLVVVGTQVQCGFPKYQVRSFMEEGKPIIEINPEPTILAGNVKVLKGTCGEFLPKMAESLKKLLN